MVGLYFSLGLTLGPMWMGCSPASNEAPEGEIQILPGAKESMQLSESEEKKITTTEKPFGPETQTKEQDSSNPDDRDHETDNTLDGSTTQPESEDGKPDVEPDVDGNKNDEKAEAEPTPEHVSDRDEQDPPNPPDSKTTDNSAVGQICSVAGVGGVCLSTTDCTGQRRSVPGYCPGPSTVQCCIPDSSGTGSYCAVAIPSSCQPVSAFSTTCSCSTPPPPPLHAGKKEKPGQGGCPAGMIKVENFCIDQYEASLVEILPNNTEQAWSPFLHPGTRKMKAVSLEGVIPQGYISGEQAENACKTAGKRLCTDTEWLRACQGSQKNTYPYGTSKQKGWCNEDRATHPAIEYFGHSLSCVFSYISHPCINQLPASLAKTGSYTRCVTSEGVYDMMGNLHEWTSDPAGTFRGGYYVDTYRNGSGCLYRTTAHDKTHWDYSTGFRCCANLPP